MSVDASDVRAATALDAILRRAGAVFARRNGTPIAVNYGSAAGELAACVAGAGVADCSELITLEISGAPETGRSPARGLRVARDRASRGCARDLLHRP